MLCWCCLDSDIECVCVCVLDVCARCCLRGDASWIDGCRQMFDSRSWMITRLCRRLRVGVWCLLCDEGSGGRGLGAMGACKVLKPRLTLLLWTSRWIQSLYSSHLRCSYICYRPSPRCAVSGTFIFCATPRILTLAALVIEHPVPLHDSSTSTE